MFGEQEMNKRKKNGKPSGEELTVRVSKLQEKIKRLQQTHKGLKKDVNRQPTGYLLSFR